MTERRSVREKKKKEKKKDDEDGFEIHGKVTGREGKPLVGARVVVWWQRIRERTELAAGETSEEGIYRLNYRVPGDAPRPVLIVVEALSEYLESALNSPQTPAQKNLEVNLDYEPPDKSEWAKLIRAITPLIGDLKISELVENGTHQDISFLARETGNSAEVIMKAIVSVRLESAFKVSAPAFYAFLRQHVPSSLPSPLLDASQGFTLIDALVHQIGSLIFGLSAQIQQQTVTTAVTQNMIGARFTIQVIQDIVAQLQALHTTDLLNQPYLVGNTTLSELLGVAAVPAAQQHTFASALATNTQSMRNFWRTLGDGHHGFTATEASTIERTLSIGSFVKNYVPLVQTLLSGFSAGTYKSLSDLARLSVSDWIAIVNKTGAPPGIDAAGMPPAEVFARVVYTRVTRTFPTVALASRITGGSFVKPERQRQPLAQFFQNNPTLELVKDNVPAYISAQGNSKAFAGIDESDKPAVISNIRAFQRVLRVSPDPDVAQALLGLGIGSATQIASMGQQQFFAKATAAGLTKPEANLAFQAAAQRYAAVVSTFVQLNNGALGVWPQSMGSLSSLAPVIQTAVQQDPTLTTLFGSQDYCETDDCTSVLSPAAYLCDLLLWLRNHKQGSQTALDVLDARRPDIRHLLLDCPNTDTELPYIDLVIEILADQVSPPTDPNSTTNPTWKQTSEGLTSDQLSAAPQYFNQGAFVKLFSASYPQTLPYSTGLDELRTYLQQWNLPLWQLRQALLPIGGGTIAQQASIAAERLKMNVQAERLVTVPNFVLPAVAWNTSDFSATPPNGLAMVPVFLQAASLTYESLLELLQVQWVQGGLGIVIQGADDTCNTGTQTLAPAPLDPGFLDRAHRFMRLWLATGYKMWELDMLLRAPIIGNGLLNQRTLVELQAFWQVQQATNLTVDRLLAFYQDMDTSSHRDPDGRATTSLYGQVSLNPTVTWATPDPDMANLPAVVESPYTQRALTNGKAYYYVVTATNSFGESPASSEVSATPTAPTTTPATVPSAVTATPGSGEVVISWGVVPGASDYYDIYWSTSPGVTPASGTEIQGVQSPYVQTGLTNGATYYYIVTAVNSVGEGAPSTEVSASPSLPVAVPSAPAGVTAAPGNAQMTIEWSPAQWATGYDIYWSTSPGVTTTNGTQIADVESPYVQDGLVNGTAYYYIVTAVNSIGEGVPSGETSAMPTAPATAPAAPSGVAATAADGEVVISWDPVPGATSYNIYWSTTLGVTTANGTEIAGSQIGDPILRDHLMAIQPALGVSAADAATLLDLARNKLTLDNLSLIYRVSALAQASKLPISQLLSVARLLNPTAPTASAALSTPFTSPAATLAFLKQAASIQQGGLSIDALAYLLTPPSAKSPGGWETTTMTTTTAPQMTPAEIAATLDAVQQAVQSLLSTSTTLASAITSASQTTITVTGDVGFSSPNFYVYIGSEILCVTAVGGTGNKTWTVLRGQQGTTASTAAAGAPVTPTMGDISGVVIATVAANAHGSSSSPLSNAVAALILQKLNVPGVGKSLLNVLMDPSLISASGTITIGGAPAAGDVIQTVITDQVGDTFTVTYTVAPGSPDVGSANQTATDFAAAINASPAVTGPKAFLAQCTVSGAVITLAPLNPGTPGSAAVSTNTATPGGGGAGHASVSPGTTQTIGLPGFQNQFIAVQLYDKVGVLVRGLRLVTTDLGWLLSSASLYGGLDLTQLPVTTGQPALGLSQLLTTLLLVKVARLFTAAPASSPIQTLYDVMAGVNDGTLATEAQTQAAVSSITGWPLADIEAFAPALSLVFPGSYTQPAVYDALRTLEAMSSAVATTGPVATAPGTTLATPITTTTQTSITVTSDVDFPSPSFYVSIGSEILLVTSVSGADNTAWAVKRAQQGTTPAIALAGAAVTPTYGAQIVTWGGIPADEVSAESLAASALGTLKARQPSDAAWLALAPTLMNPTRENRSAALQAYLIGTRDGHGNLMFPGTDALFNYFLIDTQMSSCQLTSRTVQAYIAVQVFVERCLMNMEAPAVTVDLNQDETWNQWEWMSRYRVWEANREVFLFPENWLIESQRPNRTEIYQTFEQEVHAGAATADYLEVVVQNYIDRLDGVAHLRVTGTCQDPKTGAIYVVARTHADPPVYYVRSYSVSSPAPGASGAWSGWSQIPIGVKAHQAVPAFYGGRLCLFWPEIKISNEPTQVLPAAEPTSSPPPQGTDRYVSMGLNFSIFRNGSWAPPQVTKDKLFDKPIQLTTACSDAGPFPQTAVDVKTIEALYTLKVQAASAAPGYGTSLLIDVFRNCTYDASSIITAIEENLAIDVLNQVTNFVGASPVPTVAVPAPDPTAAVQIGRAVFDGRFSDLELNSDLEVIVGGGAENLFTWAQATYGPEAEGLLPLSSLDPDLTGEPNLLPKDSAQVTSPAASSGGPFPFISLTFTGLSSLNQTPGTLLTTASLPFRLVGPVTDVNPGFDPTSYFFFQDNRRCYYVESQKRYWTGSTFSPVVPSNPATVPYEERYYFHVFYHPFTRLFWHQLASGGFDLLYSPDLQQNPDQIDTSHADVFSFQSGYGPVIPPVWWDHDDVTGKDRQFLDFGVSASYSVYNWELFYHIPMYIAQLLSQNQQFDDARTWFEYIFNPTSTSSDSVPQRFWITKPLHDLNSAQILQERINDLLQAVNTGDPTLVALVQAWRDNPFNPFVVADLRNGVPYMKSTIMSFLDNLIAQSDNLFSTESREALSEATLLYVTAQEILGPTPSAIPPPETVDESFDQLEPKLDAFANAMAEVENSVGGAGGTSGGGSGGGGVPNPQAFYFKIPPNEKLLGYWSTVADRLYKLRHCQSITGAPLQLALFDAPIDPGLLIKAQAAGVDLTSVLADIAAPVPNYRFTALYPQALDFVNAVRAYGSSLQAALEKADAGSLALLQQTLQQQLLSDGNQILDWQAQAAQDNVDATNQTLALARQKYTFNTTQPFMNEQEQHANDLMNTEGIMNSAIAIVDGLGGLFALIPDAHIGANGAGGTPEAKAQFGGKAVAASFAAIADGMKSAVAVIDANVKMNTAQGSYQRRQDNWTEAAAEAQIQVTQAQSQLDAANMALNVAQKNQELHQEQIDELQRQIDFLNSKFTSNSLYDWMVGSLSQTYFQSYQLAYQLCKQVERCYQFELGIQDTSFIQFGYWDSLYKGLLSGESLNQDLRRMQSSYLQQNARRYELSRYVSLEQLNPTALQNLLVNGSCDFDLPESLFDNDYPGHYNRRLTRVSVTVVYPNSQSPNAGKYDNVKATLTLTANKVRGSMDTTSGYKESPSGSDSRFIYSYAANAQKIATGNAQDDPGLFLTSITNNLTDQRYLPFENAGAISSWHLEMPQANNEIDLSTVGDVVIHVYYTALDGGADFQTTVESYYSGLLPSSGVKLFSTQNDFASAWQAFLAKPSGGADQTLSLMISPSKFPPWTRTKTITIQSFTVIAAAWPTGVFIVEPQAPLPNSDVTTTAVAGSGGPYLSSVTVNITGGMPLGNAPWVFKVKQQGAADFYSLTSGEIGDVMLLVNYTAS
jgi:hypothetical protein